MENYIVRIYRHEKDYPRNIVGVVETVGIEGKKAFTNIDELWDILNPRKMTKPETEERGNKHDDNL